MDGYCVHTINELFILARWSSMAGGALLGQEIHTEVVRTPQSNSGLVGVRAGGVSIHSKVSSDVVPLLILLWLRNFVRHSGESGRLLDNTCAKVD
jgi:hypothetical protein